MKKAASPSKQPAPHNRPVDAIRAAAISRGLYKKIFAQGNTRFDGAGVAAAMRSLIKVTGVDVPKDVILGLDSAQIILAGGAFIADVEAGDEILQCGSGAALAMGATTLLSDLGVIDSTAGDFLGLAANIALVVASGGSNVLADVGVVLSTIAVACDVSRDWAGTQEQAVGIAKSTLSKQIHGILDPQVEYATQALADMNAGRLDFFDFVAGIARFSPAEFKNFFPTLSALFPSWTSVTVVGVGVSDGWFGSHRDVESYTIKDILITSDLQVADVMLDAFIVRPLSIYDNWRTVKPTISFRAIQLLSLILATNPSGPVEMGFNFSVLTAMRSLGLTPSKLGDSWLFHGLMRNENDLSDSWKDFLPYHPKTLPYVAFPSSGGVVINGRPYYTPDQESQAKQAAELKAFQLYLAELDRKGDIESLCAIPEARAMLESYCDIRVDPTFDPVIGEISNFKLTGQSIRTQAWYAPGFYGKDHAYDERFWSYVKRNYSIDVSDYWKCLGILKQMGKSNLYSTGAGRDDYQKVLKKYIDLDQLLADADNLRKWVIMKMLNQRARASLAKQLGIPAGELAHRNNPDGTKVFYRNTRKVASYVVSG